MVASFCFPLAVSYGQESPSKKDKNVVLTPADQLILEAIDKVREDLSDRIDKVREDLSNQIDKVNERIDKLAQNLNGRIDNLWITMLGGFLGVMAFIGAIVFWDRRTFVRRAREEFRDEVSEDRNKLEAIVVAMRKLGEQFPEVREVLRSFGLL
jgi:chaperonin cofactor prefoldin